MKTTTYTIFPAFNLVRMARLLRWVQCRGARLFYISIGCARIGRVGFCNLAVLILVYIRSVAKRNGHVWRLSTYWLESIYDRIRMTHLNNKIEFQKELSSSPMGELKAWIKSNVCTSTPQSFSIYHRLNFLPGFLKNYYSGNMVGGKFHRKTNKND